MDDKTVLKELESLAERLDITVRYEPLKIGGSFHTGGYCRFNGREYVIIHQKVSLQDKIQVLAQALRRRDLGHVYVLPSLRKILGEEETPMDDGNT